MIEADLIHVIFRKFLKEDSEDTEDCVCQAEGYFTSEKAVRTRVDKLNEQYRDEQARLHGYEGDTPAYLESLEVEELEKLETHFDFYTFEPNQPKAET